MIVLVEAPRITMEIDGNLQQQSDEKERNTMFFYDDSLPFMFDCNAGLIAVETQLLVVRLRLTQKPDFWILYKQTSWPCLAPSSE